MTTGVSETKDQFLRGQFELIQPVQGHRSGLDALLLAATVPDEGEGSILDLGAGSGAVGFAVASRAENCRVTLVETDLPSCERAARGLKLDTNADFASRVEVLRCNVAELARNRAPEAYDVVLANPPFNGDHYRSSPNGDRARAHDGDRKTVQAWWQVAARMVRPHGTVTFILRAEAWLDSDLPRVLGDVRLLPIHPKATAPASRIIVSARKGRRARPSILPGLVLHEHDGRFTPSANRIFEGRDVLPLGR